MDSSLGEERECYKDAEEQGKEQGMEEAPVAEHVGIRYPELESKDVGIGNCRAQD